MSLATIDTNSSPFYRFVVDRFDQVSIAARTKAERSKNSKKQSRLLAR